MPDKLEKKSFRENLNGQIKKAIWTIFTEKPLEYLIKGMLFGIIFIAFHLWSSGWFTSIGLFLAVFFFLFASVCGVIGVRQKFKPLEITSKTKEQIESKKELQIQLPYFEEKEQRELIISLNKWVFEVNKLIKNKGEDFFDEDFSEFQLKHLLAAERSEWRVNVSRFLKTRFGEDFFIQLNFDKKFPEPEHALSYQRSILDSIINELKQELIKRP